MSTIINYHINKEVFLLACNICEQGNPSIIHDSINCKEIENLLKLNAFIVGRKYWLEDKRGNFVDIIYKNDQVGYFDKKGRFIRTSYNEVYSYKLDFNWIIKTIANDLDIDKCYPPEMIVDNLFWRIGSIRLKKEIPVFFARIINNKNNFERIYKILSSRNGINQGIVLTTSSSAFLGLALPGSHQIISLRDCLRHDSNSFHIDKNIIKAALGIRSELLSQKDGFSSGYRTGYFNDIEYSFTKKQAAIIEILDKYGGKMNKHELLSEANSEQYDVYRIFRNNQGKYHTAWNVIIKYDNKGNYWLDI